MLNEHQYNNESRVCSDKSARMAQCMTCQVPDVLKITAILNDIWWLHVLLHFTYLLTKMRTRKAKTQESREWYARLASKSVNCRPLTLNFDLLTPKLIIWCLSPWTTCASWHQNPFICIQNIVFTSLLTDKLMHRRTNGQVENIMPPSASLAWQRYNKKISYR